MTRFDNAREQLAAVQKRLTDRLPDRRELEDRLSALGSRLDDVSNRIEALRDAVAPSVKGLVDTVRDAAVSAAEEAAKEAPRHKKKIKKAAERARADAEKAFAEFQRQTAPKKKRHVGLVIVLSLAGAAVAGAAFAAVRAVTLADEQWIGIDEDLEAGRDHSDDAPDSEKTGE